MILLKEASLMKSVLAIWEHFMCDRRYKGDSQSCDGETMVTEKFPLHALRAVRDDSVTSAMFTSVPIRPGFYRGLDCSAEG